MDPSSDTQDHNDHVHLAPTQNPSENSDVPSPSHPSRSSSILRTGSELKSADDGRNVSTYESSTSRRSSIIAQAAAQKERKQSIFASGDAPAIASVLNDVGWLSDLDVSAITKKKTTMDPYTSACKVLGVVPVSSFQKNLGGKEIVMKHHGLGPKGAQAIAEVLETNTTLTMLDLSDNWIESGGEFIGKSLHTNYTLTHLNLSNNRLGAKGGKEMAEMLRENNTLKTLILRGNKLTDREAECFAGGLRDNSCLQVLDLSYNQIGDIGAIALGHGLGGNDALKELNLAWNNIRSKGFTGLLTSLRDNMGLMKLNLESNGLGDNGVPLAAFLSKSSAIQSVNIRATRASDVAMLAIAKSVEGSSSLKELDVSENPFMDAGAIALLKAALTSNSMQGLFMKNIKMTKETRTKMDEVRKEKPELQIVDV
ncbi:hypothetical protein BJ742DRAFT_901591 [Cladochytrium replicatum]|nr:hypothetical protein BJ742DRAFT_901591 [Cladochytrium replicatum]